MRKLILGMSAAVLAACASMSGGSEKLDADTPRTTPGGASFTAPAGWSLGVRGNVTLLEAPEHDAHVALVDVDAADAKAAEAAAWSAYRAEGRHPLKVVTPIPARQGWDERQVFQYEVSPNEKAVVSTVTLRKDKAWTVLIIDGAVATLERRGAQVDLVGDSLRPKGYQKETFAGKKAHPLDAGRVQKLRDFVETARKELHVPGVGLVLIENGKTVWEGGFGVRALGQPKPVNAETLFMIGSNTKALSTLLLARLVDAGKFDWDTPVTKVFPSFKLGDADTTRHVEIRHLVCACTGMPRQDYELIFNFKSQTPESEVEHLGTLQPTSKFGEVFQYSNQLAAVAGFVAAHVAHPDRKLGPAYDAAMKEQVFGPLGMTRATLDIPVAQRRNHAEPHGDDADGHAAAAPMDLNWFAPPLAPAGAAWASVHDMAKYVSMELARGKLPDGKPYVSEKNLLKRRERNVDVGPDAWYGMGLETDHTWGVNVIHHGGATAGYQSDMLWLPEYGVGAVVLTNSGNGYGIMRPFMRRLLEVMFDGEPQALEDVKSTAKNIEAGRAAERPRLTIPADPKAVAKLAPRYKNDVLGDIRVVREGGKLTFDFDGWKSPMASRKNDDGTLSYITIAPGFIGLEFVVTDKDGKRALVARDAQHEYVYDEVK